MDETNIWCEWLNIILPEKGISKKMLCRDTGISGDTVKRWTNRNGDVNLRTAIKVLDYLGYDIVFKKRR